MSAPHFKPDIDWDRCGMLGRRSPITLTDKALDELNRPPKSPDWMLRTIVLSGGALAFFNAVRIFLHHFHF